MATIDENYWKDRADDAEDRADDAIDDAHDAHERYVKVEKRYVTLEEGFDDLYDELTEEWIRNSDLKEELDRAMAAYESLVDLIVLFEPNLRESIADEPDYLKDKFEEFTHELHRSLIARS
jgi:hypothetical protein